MAKEILTRKQKEFLNFFANQKDLANIFYLSGGTALAGYYLFHRCSDDLDFFTNSDDFDWGKIFQFIELAKNEFKAKKVVYNKLYDRRMFYFKFEGNSELKVEFTHYPFPQLETPKIHAGIKVDSLLDIATNKFFTIIDRAEVKDYIDLYFIAKYYSFKKLHAAVKKKFGFKIDFITLGSRLILAKEFTLMPKMVKKLEIDKFKNFYLKESRKLKSIILV